MRKVRNHIAHKTKSTRTDFAAVVSRVYISQPRGISPGKLLLSPRLAFVGASGHGREPVVVQYLRWSKAAIKNLTKS
jgi:hypothetical protein